MFITLERRDFSGISLRPEDIENSTTRLIEENSKVISPDLYTLELRQVKDSEELALGYKTINSEGRFVAGLVSYNYYLDQMSLSKESIKAKYDTDFAKLDVKPPLETGFSQYIKAHIKQLRRISLHDNTRLVNIFHYIGEDYNQAKENIVNIHRSNLLIIQSDPFFIRLMEHFGLEIKDEKVQEIAVYNTKDETALESNGVAVTSDGQEDRNTSDENPSSYQNFYLNLSKVALAVFVVSALATAVALCITFKVPGISEALKLPGAPEAFNYIGKAAGVLTGVSAVTGLVGLYKSGNIGSNGGSGESEMNLANNSADGATMTS